MRATKAQETEVRFECSETDEFRRSRVWQESDIVVEKIAGNVVKTFTTYCEIGPNTGFMALRDSGAILVRSESSPRWHLTPSVGVGVTAGPRRFLVRMAKGAHSMNMVRWPLDQSESLSRILEDLIRMHPECNNGLGLPTRSAIPHFQSGMDRFAKGIACPNRIEGAALILSVISEAIAFVGDDASDSMLAPTPRNLPEVLQQLIDDVRQNPKKAWPLKEASEQAGYSPFHFSRIFKQIVGIGFHEFVDRTRTEMAAELLCATEEHPDIIAMQAGFGTAQGMRDSVREYLGLVPSELRSDPHDSLTN